MNTAPVMELVPLSVKVKNERKGNPRGFGKVPANPKRKVDARILVWKLLDLGWEQKQWQKKSERGKVLTCEKAGNTTICNGQGLGLTKRKARALV